MATLVLSAVGSAVGGAIAGPVGAMLGRAAGALGGALVDQAVFGDAGDRRAEGPRLASFDLTASTEGAPIARLYGRSRLAGQIIWATRLEEERVQEETRAEGGKGMGGGASATTTTFRYFANFAVGLCEGPATRVGRVWADGRELDRTRFTIRAYAGGETQGPDSLISAKEGAGDAPAYRGLVYLVFERMPLADFGNRIPQITAEVFNAVGALEPMIPGVALIPGSTEFGYEPEPVSRLVGYGDYAPDNRHTMTADSDWNGALDLLADVAPNARTVCFVVAWFGTDLRCGDCEVKPKVERRDRRTFKGVNAFDWRVVGLSREEAEEVSRVAGAPAYGGAPNDASIIAAIADLKARGHRAIFYPFVMMDVAAGNALPHPYGGASQPPYPWRGRITCHPAPGRPGSPDRSAAAAAQVAAFVGGARAEHFVGDFTGAFGLDPYLYLGPQEWSYSRFVLHMAKLCQLAGGVDAFCVGSEMIGMTTVRSGARKYPFVDALRDLAGETRKLLGPGAELGYAADWSEYHSHRPDDGSGDVIFHLDPLWADANIDFIGIDNYLPLADWRDGADHADHGQGGATSVHDRDYLRANVEGGEYFDWYYADAAARAAQQRTPIADGHPAGEPWIFRNKDIRSWWENPHHDRPGGARLTGATAWTPRSKPIVFTEIGCPAVDKGANQPNVFYDPKSSESFLPHFSSGVRDDAMQRAYLEAALGYWAEPANNPVSDRYAGRMIRADWTCVWAWDARIPPSFPQDEAMWADAANWHLGHWLTGRLGAAPARETLAAVFAHAGFTDAAPGRIDAVVDAVIADRPMSARAMIDALAPVYGFVATESDGAIRIGERYGAAAAGTLARADLAEEPGEDSVWRIRAQETELPASISLVHTGYAPLPNDYLETELPASISLVHGEPASDDLPAAVRAARQATASVRTVQIAAPVVMPAAYAQSVAERMLREAWIGRETAELILPPSFLALDPGDVVRLDDEETWRITGIVDADARRLSLERCDAGLAVASAAPARTRPVAAAPVLGPPEFAFVDGPLLRDGDRDFAGYVAASATPWAGGVAFWRSPDSSGFVRDTVLAAPAQMGRTLDDLYSGPVWRWDVSNAVRVEMASGTLASAADLAVFAGANALAVDNGAGEWEILQFAEAELVGPRTYRLSRLLRGQRGSEHAMRDFVPAGARVVGLGGALAQPGIPAAQIGLPLNWRIGPASRDVADAAYAGRMLTLEGRGRRPLSPVALRGRRDHATGDWHVSWLRRTRIGGDAWGAADAPLGEAREGYVVEVLDAAGANVLRTVERDAPGWTYTAGQQTGDFGAPQWNLRMRISQISETFGRGSAAEALLWDY